MVGLGVAPTGDIPVSCFKVLVRRAPGNFKSVALFHGNALRHGRAGPAPAAMNAGR